MSIPEEWLWPVIVGFIIAFVLAFGIGANDVANSFGTSVGSKVLTLFQACVLATIFEILGAILIGSRVSDTIRKGIIDVSPYNGSESSLIMGNVAALGGTCIWLLTATALRLPVSATHSIVGATIGFSLVAQGVRGIGWMKLGMIIGSWFISPLMSGVVSMLVFMLLRKLVLSKEKPLEPGLRTLPIFYGVTVVINAFSVFYDGSQLLHFHKIPLYGVMILSFGLGILICILVRFVVVPWQRKRILADLKVVDNPESIENGYVAAENVDMNIESGLLKNDRNQNEDKNAKNQLDTPIVKNQGRRKIPNPFKKKVKIPEKEETTVATIVTDIDAESAPLKIKDIEADSPDVTISNQSLTRGRDEVKDKPEAARLFSFLQILTAIFGSFAHGGNDVSNAIGPVVALWMISNEGTVMQKAPTPIWILLFGGVGISIGLCVWGRRVMKTMGEDLSKITPSSGFCIEIGSALTVLIASNVGIPISTTHCKVGSIVFVGRARSNENVDWSLFRNIIVAWLVTLPISGGLSAAIFAGLQLTI
ncbi:sodium-dependent phosphate transporter 1 [Patella vulgata]|uniref:sodium-dependent phosphate transporter 1 n=1 Tax=Patella vulgata TaxID=6465 RepID=UPI00217F7157|nr:sodium-dependent phosphate transporter 1 [Patella vulgata]